MAYRSIFMARDWQHACYLGWQDSWPDPALRVMTQRRGPVRRVLAVSEIADTGRLADLWPQVVGRRSVLSEVRFHDLTGTPAVGAWLGERRLIELGRRERMLNVATIVIDLAPDAAALRAAMTGDTRRKLRRAEEAGLRFVADAHRSPQSVAAFLAAFDAMAAERGLQRLDPAIVRRMIDDGRARLFAVADDDSPQTFLLSYETDGIGFFASGAAVGRQNDGAGQLLHWGAIQAFKHAGHRWYDMGGVASTDPGDGIYRFKKGFGGSLVSLGREYGRSGIAIRGLRALRRAA